jgi:Rieske Fe-S protein
MLEVSDLERSEQFYEEGIGLEALGRDLWPEDGPNTTFTTAGGQYVVLLQVDQVRPDGPGVHTNFIAPPEDYPAIYDRLGQLSCLVVDHRDAQRSVGEVSTYFTDPDGHRLQVTAYTEDAFRVPAAGRGKVVAGRVEDFPPGSVTHHKEGKFFLVHIPEGILALNEICTHQHCIVTYQPEHYRFYCACHYNRFTRTGEHLGHIAGTPPLHAYAVELVDGQIVVDTDRTIPRTVEDTASLAHLLPLEGVSA